MCLTPQILIQKYRLLTLKPMRTTCTAHQTAVKSGKSMQLKQKSNINLLFSQVTLEEVWAGMFES